MMDWMTGDWIVIMAIFLLLVIALLVLAAWAIVRFTPEGGGGGPRSG